ncbi:hypothetical protein FSARC_4754 [Fusarium sarcochroum]|uniref:2EXR domain-containing protein n=1 Tax=Fusarium sarcochroum TaxID=1208366 RepID=A0A8H4U0Y2_9HYPO|nr:hypothetical protein FSARC_4754 [Fusarium sarcochroum]
MKHPHTFTLFPNLPPELRNQIWHQALPELSQPGLFSYHRKGCWQPKWLTPEDWDYYPGDYDNIRFEFRHDLITMPVEMPLFFVNCEARDIALPWIRDNDIEIRFSEDRLHFIRRLDSELDALYLPMEKMLDFDMEPVDRMFEPDLIERMLSEITHLRHFAMSEEFFHTEEILPEAWGSFGIRVLYVIVGTQPDVQGQWELEEGEGKSVVWNIESRKFELENGVSICDEILYQLILEDKKGIGKALVDHHLADKPLEIRPVKAVRK